MLTNNAKNTIVETMRITTGSRTQPQLKTTAGDIITVNDVWDGPNRSAPLNQMFDIVAQTPSTATDDKSVIVIGTGTSPVSRNDFVFAVNPQEAVSESNPSTAVETYTINSVQKTNTSRQNFDAQNILTQTMQFTGETATTITEVGLLYKCWYYKNNAQFLLARELLSTPITVNNGDTFTVSMTIG